MSRKRVKAFTIMEVTIAMLISAIAIGITYSIYLIVNKSYQSYNDKNAKMATVLRLDEMLWRDFDKCTIILKDTAGITIQYPNQSIDYKFDTAYVVRRGSITDTFKVKSDSLNTFFEKRPVNEMGSSDEQNRLDQLDLSIMLQNEKITYHYHKVYSSANLINRKPDAVN